MCVFQYGNGRRRHKRGCLVSIESSVPMETLERYKYITDKELKNKIDEAMKEIGEHKRIDIHTGAKSLEAIKSDNKSEWIQRNIS